MQTTAPSSEKGEFRGGREREGEGSTVGGLKCSMKFIDRSPSLVNMADTRSSMQILNEVNWFKLI